MEEIQEALPKTFSLIQEGIEKKLHNGVQLYVSHDGRTVADAGIGEARPDVPLTSETIMLWLSAGKPLTALAIAQAWEEDRFDLDDRVARFIPAFSRNGKERITFRHLLTHTAGLQVPATGWPKASWEEIIERICNSELEPDWIPGHQAGYQPAAGWFILGEFLQRLEGKSFAQLMRDKVCQPLGMNDTWFSIPAEEYSAYGDQIAMMFYLDQGELKRHRWHTEERCAAVSPGGNVRGPVRELGRFYEMLLNRGTGNERRIVSVQSVEAMTARHRVGMFDKTFRHKVDFGLGLVIDSNLYGEQTVPYGFGRYCSRRTFGHGGAQSSIGFADPENRLVVAVAANGMPGERRHNQRSRAINEAIYTDLGLAGE